MNVNLISYSKSDGSYLIDSTSATELVAFCARVSNPENQMNSFTFKLRTEKKQQKIKLNK